MLSITEHIIIADHEIEMHAIRAQGAGGQHVNKVSSTIHLRFDIQVSSLLDECKAKLLKLLRKRVRYDWLSQYIFKSIKQVQEHATKWLWTCTNDRPNMLIGGITPIQKLVLVA